MELRKYPHWQKYILKNENKKEAYKTFAYWKKLKEQNFKTDFNFNLPPDILKEKFLKDYSNYKTKIFLSKLIEKYPIKFHMREIKKIKDCLLPLNMKVANILRMTESLIISNNLDRSSMPIIVTEAIEKMKWFYSLRNIDDVINKVTENGFSPKIAKVNKDIAIQYINNKEDLTLFASPSWCTNYSSAQIDRYNKYNVIYIWEKKHDHVELYGVNFNEIHGYIESIFDSMNNEKYDSKMRETFKIAIGEDLYLEHIERIKNKLAEDEGLSKALLLILNLANDEELKTAIKDLDFYQLKKLIELMLERPFPLNERFEKIASLMIEEGKWSVYLTKRIISNDYFSSQEANSIIKFLMKSNNLEYIYKNINFYIDSISKNYQLELFKKLTKVSKVSLTNSINSIVFYKNMSIDQKKDIKETIKRESPGKIKRILHEVGDGFLNKELFRVLVKNRKIDVNDIGVEFYKNNESALNLKLKIEFFRNTNVVTKQVVALMMCDESIPMKEITTQWINEHKLTFKNIKDMPTKKLDSQYLNRVYTEDDFYNDKTTEEFKLKLKFVKYYYTWRYWLKSNEEYSNRIKLLLKSKMLNENEITSLFQTKNRDIYEKDLELMKDTLDDKTINLSINNKFAIFNEIINKKVKNENQYLLKIKSYIKLHLINDFLEEGRIKSRIAFSLIEDYDIDIALKYIENYERDLKNLNIEFIKLIYNKALNTKSLDKEIKKNCRNYITILKFKSVENKEFESHYNKEKDRMLSKYGKGFLGFKQ